MESGEWSGKWSVQGGESACRVCRVESGRGERRTYLTKEDAHGTTIAKLYLYSDRL